MSTAAFVATCVLLGVASVLTIVCAIGMLVVREPWKKLQFVAPPAAIAALLVSIAIRIADPRHTASMKALFVFLAFVAMNGIAAHATARAASAKQDKRWPPDANDRDVKVLPRTSAVSRPSKNGRE
jgi:multisubunit Na+/H+ antiporter MnhG subunit